MPRDQAAAAATSSAVSRISSDGIEFGLEVATQDTFLSTSTQMIMVSSPDFTSQFANTFAKLLRRAKSLKNQDTDNVVIHVLPQDSRASIKRQYQFLSTFPNFTFASVERSSAQKGMSFVVTGKKRLVIETRNVDFLNRHTHILALCLQKFIADGTPEDEAGLECDFLFNGKLLQTARLPLPVHSDGQVSVEEAISLVKRLQEHARAMPKEPTTEMQTSPSLKAQEIIERLSRPRQSGQERIDSTGLNTLPGTPPEAGDWSIAVTGPSPDAGTQGPVAAPARLFSSSQQQRRSVTLQALQFAGRAATEDPADAGRGCCCVM